MRRVSRLAALIAACCVMAVGYVVAAQAGNPNPPGHGGTPPGRDACDHGLGNLNGNAGPCKDDPQPARGKDCEVHGINGGVNEDHCNGGGGGEGEGEGEGGGEEDVIGEGSE
jgi:hypothetical protein